MTLLAFDIETIPDVAAGRRLFGLEGLDDAAVAEAMFQRRRQQTGGDFLQHHLHQVASIACALRTADGFKVWSIGKPEAGEAELVQRFFDGIEQFTPDLVSWNGKGFDLPVLHYRALFNGVRAPRYWEMGETDRDFKWNNYLNKYHWRHLDLMDALAGFEPRARASLDDVAQLCGLPGKLGIGGAKVWDAVKAGELGAVRDYCECDALNTYLIALRFEVLRGIQTPEELAAEHAVVREALLRDGRAHLQEFVAAWDAAAKARDA
jgi:predicted PolB exonuclease-like 3'-5' exonuclease